MQDRRRRGRSGRSPFSERGTALVEFALVLPLVALICLGTVDFGRAYATYNKVKNAAREAAAFAQFAPGQQKDYGGTCASPNNIESHAQNETGTAGTPDTSFLVTVSPVVSSCNPLLSTPATGSTVTVTVKKSFTILTPFVRSVVGGNPMIRASVAVRVQ
jgi:Flp pilus assembly protein TadG